jgi:hypothetical protein
MATKNTNKVVRILAETIQESSVIVAADTCAKDTSRSVPKTRSSFHTLYTSNNHESRQLALGLAERG